MSGPVATALFEWLLLVYCLCADWQWTRYILEVPNCWHPFPEESPGVAPGAHKTRFEGDV